MLRECEQRIGLRSIDVTRKLRADENAKLNILAGME